MKKILSLALLATLFLSVSCVKGEKFADESLMKAPGFSGYILPMPCDDAPGTKASVSTAMKFSFAMGDRINIWSDSGTLLIYSVTELTEGGGANFDGGGFALVDGSTYYSTFPLIANFEDDLTNITVSFEGQVQKANNDANHVAKYTNVRAKATCEDGRASFAYANLNRWLRLYLTLPKSMEVSELTLTADRPVFAKTCSINVVEGTLTPVTMTDTMTLGFSNVTVTDGQLNAFMALSTYEECDVIIKVKDTEGNVYSSPVVHQNAATSAGQRGITTALTQEAPDTHPGGNEGVGGGVDD